MADSILMQSLYVLKLPHCIFTFLNKFELLLSYAVTFSALESLLTACVHRYNYNRDDEEVYKEFLEIANEMIPNVMRTSSGDQSTATDSAAETLPPTEHTADKLPLTSDPECYAMVLQFYDGLCEWEEGSSTPVLHITWAQHALYSLGRFDVKARANLTLKSAAPEDDVDSKSDDSAVSSHSAKLRQTSDSLHRSTHKAYGKPSKTVSPASLAYDDNKSPPDTAAIQTCPADTSTEVKNTEDKPDALNAKISDEQTVSEKSPPSTVDLPADASEVQASTEADGDSGDTVQACLVLRSEKMTGMKDLLVAERLNSGAIKLQLTAQSQVHLRHSRTAAAADYAVSDITPSSVSRKRIRRE